MTGPRRIAIVGGGIAGLAAAYEIDRRLRSEGLAVEARLFESSPAAGGVIRTERVDGFLLDTGPDSLFRGKPAAAALARELGIGAEIIEARVQEQPTLIWSRGRLRPLPAGLELVAPTRIVPFLLSGLISMPGKVRMAMEPFVAPRRDGVEESVAGFVRRRLGDEAARRIAGPLLAGIHAGDPERLSIQATFPRLPELEQRHGSLARGIAAARGSRRGGPGVHPAPAGPPFSSFRTGIRRIVEGLQAAIRKVSIETSTPVERIEQDGPGYRVVTASKAPWRADACIVAVPGAAAARLLEPVSPALAGCLRSVRYATSATVFLGFDAEEAGPLPGSTGFLIPSEERRRIFGCTFVSNKFEGRAPDGKVLLRVFVGGALDEPAAEQSDAEILALVRRELRELIGLTAEPRMVHIARWPSANPQYDVGHSGVVAAVDRHLGGLPGLYVTGSAFRGVGIPDGVTLGRAAAGQALAALGHALPAAPPAPRPAGAP